MFMVPLQSVPPRTTYRVGTAVLSRKLQRLTKVKYKRISNFVNQNVETYVRVEKYVMPIVVQDEIQILHIHVTVAVNQKQHFCYFTCFHGLTI